MPGKSDLRRRSRRGRYDVAWPVVLSAVLLAGAVAAAVSAAMLRFAPNDSPRIASVRLGEMTVAYAVKAAGENAAAAAVASDARAWGAALEAALARVAARHDVVLLPARAVAAGAPDMTARVEAVLAALLASVRIRAQAVRPSGSNP